MNRLHKAAAKGNLDKIHHLLGLKWFDITRLFESYVYPRVTPEIIYIDALNEDFCTALQVAASRGQLEVIELLLRCGANIDALSGDNESALLMAAKKGQEQAAQVLILHGADVNAMSKSGHSALQWACGQGMDRLVELLLESEADPNILDQEGESPLHWAVMVQTDSGLKITELLLQHGADVFATTKRGQRAKDMVDGPVSQQILALLEEAESQAEAAEMEQRSVQIEHPLNDSLKTEGNHLPQGGRSSFRGQLAAMTSQALWCVRAAADTQGAQGYLRLARKVGESSGAPLDPMLAGLNVTLETKHMVIFKPEGETTAYVVFTGAADITNKRNHEKWDSRWNEKNSAMSRQRAETFNSLYATQIAVGGGGGSRAEYVPPSRPGSAVSKNRPLTAGARPASAMKKGSFYLGASQSFSEKFSTKEKKPQGGDVPCKELLMDRRLARPTGWKGQVHHGALVCAQRISLPHILNLLYRYQVVLCGHGLGGAVATLTAARLAASNPEYVKSLQVLTFGQPLVGDEEFVSYLGKLGGRVEERFHNFVYGEDLLPRSLLFHSHFLDTPGLVDAVAETLEAIVEREPLYKVLGPWSAAVVKLLSAEPHSASLASSYTRTGEETFKPFGNHYFLSPETKNVLRIKEAVEVVRWLKESASTAAPSLLVHHSLDNYVTFLTSRAWGDFTKGPAAKVEANIEEKMHHLHETAAVHQKLMRLQKPMHLLQFDESEVVEEALELMAQQDDLVTTLRAKGSFSDNVLIKVLDCLERGGPLVEVPAEVLGKATLPRDMEEHEANKATALDLTGGQGAEKKAGDDTLGLLSVPKGMEAEFLSVNQASAETSALMDGFDRCEQSNFTHIQKTDFWRENKLGKGVLGETWAVTMNARRDGTCQLADSGQVAALEGADGAAHQDGRSVRELKLRLCPRQVAVKFIPRDAKAKRETDVQTCLAVAAKLSKTPHPRLVNFLGGCLHDPQDLVFVQELLPQGSLHDAIHGRRDPAARWERRGQALAAQVAEGLAWLHSQNIAMRSLSSKSVLLTDQWSAKLEGVGLFRLVQKSPHFDPSLTPYLAPEWSKWRSFADHEKGDMWSLGVLLWEMFTQMKPDPKMTDPGYFMPTMFVPTQLRKLIMECLSRNPDIRPTAKNAQKRLLEMPSSTSQRPPPDYVKLDPQALRPQTSSTAEGRRRQEEEEDNAPLLRPPSLHRVSVEDEEDEEEGGELWARHRTSSSSQVAGAARPKSAPSVRPHENEDDYLEAPQRVASVTKKKRPSSRRRVASWMDTLVKEASQQETGEHASRSESSVSIDQWSEEQVHAWVSKDLGFSDQCAKEYARVFGGMEGTHLMDLIPEDLQSMGITNEFHRDFIYKAICKEKALIVLRPRSR